MVIRKVICNQAANFRQTTISRSLWIFCLQKSDLRSWTKVEPYWSRICASEVAQRLGLLPNGLVFVGFGCRQLCHHQVCVWLQILCYPKVHSVSIKNSIVLDSDILNCLFLNFVEQCMCPIKQFSEIYSWFSVVCGVQFLFLFQIIQFPETIFLY